MLETETTVVLNWFRKNEMKSNDDKCHLIVANKESFSLNLECDIIESSNTVKLFGVFIDKQLNFNEHISKLCKKEIKNYMHIHILFLYLFLFFEF